MHIADGQRFQKIAIIAEIDFARDPMFKHASIQPGDFFVGDGQGGPQGLISQKWLII